ncbi:hypothetical protein [Paenibacillus montanisoli]|uniref:Uncharacterized protein n=1 Tax=Paenibacillus montanisoli TaxID=2081970 RepID=A0A328U7L1_9BACL|nr:hypothetical protein [Paenibacillus montanisoli]RAP78549.1 hypothetical protein DL346_09055 [Paenibacillus montanisoli]
MPITIPDIFTMDDKFEYHQDPLHFALLNMKKSAIGLELLQQFRITRIECFRFDHKLTEKLQLGDETDICGLIAISTNTGIVGIKEFAIPCKCLKGDLIMWAALFQKLKGMTLMESINYPQQKQDVWGPIRVELIESAFVDIIEKIGRRLKEGGDPRNFLDRAFLFDHAQAYISF